MAHRLDAAVVGAEGNDDRIVDPADRFDGIEQAKHADAHIAPESGLETALQFEVGLPAALFARQQHGPGVVEQVGLARRYQPHRADQGRQRARREGAAREAEDVDLVARPVVLRQEAVGAFDQAAQAPAEGQAEHPRRQLLPLEQGFLQAEGADTLVVVGQGRRGIGGQGAQHPDDVGRAIAEAVAGAVEADDELASRAPGAVEGNRGIVHDAAPCPWNLSQS